MEQSESFKPLYKKLIDIFSAPKWNGKICAFFPQEGKEFQNSEKKILFVGKSVNGWKKFSTDVDELFEHIANRKDEMRWVVDAHPKIASRHSAFWRVIKAVSVNVLPDSQKTEWYNYIAWSNLYKISPAKGGNPTAEMRLLQQKTCCEILDKEIEILKPNFIVFLTSGLENFYLKHIGFDSSEWNTSEEWGRKHKYKVLFQKKNGIPYILSQHPQGKPEKIHAMLLNKIIEKEYNVRK